MTKLLLFGPVGLFPFVSAFSYFSDEMTWNGEGEKEAGLERTLGHCSLSIPHVITISWS